MQHRVVPIVMTAAMGLAVIGANVVAAPPASGRIVFVSDRGGGFNQIYIMNADGSHLTHIAIEMDTHDPAFSPDGRKIAFVSFIANTREEIHVMNVDGSHLTRLISLPGYIESPKFSPDGRRIAFGANDQIHIMDVDGSHLTPLTNLPGGSVQPAFSPDGRRIAFAHADPMPQTPNRPQFHPQIYIMDMDGSHIAPLTRLPRVNESPTFSPDGRRIAFVGSGQGTYVIYTMDVDGSHLSRVPAPEGTIVSPTFSPDGRKIAFAYQPNGIYGPLAGTWQIYIMDADGSHLTRLTNVLAFNTDPAFGP